MDQDRAARYSDLFAARREHEAVCNHCPICATLRLVRNTRPEVVEHLAAAAREMVAAATLVLDELGDMVAADTGQADAEAAPDGVVRRIHVS